MRDVMLELKQLRLHGMAGAWADLTEQSGDNGLNNARWLVEHLLQAESVDRGMRSVKHQMHVAPTALDHSQSPRAAQEEIRAARIDSAGMAVLNKLAEIRDDGTGLTVRAL
jgi:hypothetical protein